MQIEYKYRKNGREFSGELDGLEPSIGHHDAVAAVLTKIASIEGERIVVDMMSAYIDGKRVGMTYFDPEEGKPSAESTIQSIQISEDGESWNNIALVIFK